MVGFRSRLSRIAVVWLVCQAAGLAAAPLALCCPSTAGDDSCPLHAHATASERGDHVSASERGDHVSASAADDLAPGHCTMRGTCGSVEASLMSLVGGAAVLPSLHAVAVLSTSTPLTVRSASAPSRVVLPDAPPPRA
jgi:hypothetical protein